MYTLKGTEMVKGSCLCGKVHYEAELEGSFINCHCPNCRKGHGAAFSSFAEVKSNTFRYVQGEELIKAYQSSEHCRRVFCSECGSNLVFIAEGEGASLWVAAGTFDNDPGTRPMVHIYVKEKAPWYTITDDLPQYAKIP